jgi:hypothetical protein
VIEEKMLLQSSALAMLQKDYGSVLEMVKKLEEDILKKNVMILIIVIFFNFYYLLFFLDKNSRAGESINFFKKR